MATLSYGVYIRIDKNSRKAVRDTIAIYRSAVSFLIDVCLNHYHELVNIKPGQNCNQNISHSKLVMTAVERMIHSTKNRQAMYPAFDKKFYKFPTYYRRAAINTAWGKVQAYMSKLYEWKSDNQTCRRPHLNRHPNVAPVLYRKGTYMDDPMSIKVYEDPVLDDVERRYLGNFLRPFRKRVEYVFKKRQYDGQEQIVVKFKNNNNNNPKMSDGYFNNFMYFPLFDGGKMYKGMTVGTKYSLDMLGLFTEGDE